MSGQVRHIRRDEWDMLHDRTYSRERIDFRGVETEAQLMHIGRADAPFAVPCGEAEAVIADTDYCWLQLAPKDGRWWMTAMYAPDGKPVQYYFDITSGNAVGAGKAAFFRDLYLDYVLHADGTVIELDRDELEWARDRIGEDEYRAAVKAGEELKAMLNEAPMAEFDAIYARLRNRDLCRWEEL